MNKKKLLICFNSSNYGGVEKQILDIIKGLSNEIDIYTAVPSGELLPEYKKAGIIKNFEIYPKFEADFFYSYKIWKLVKENKIDIIHAHELKTGSLAIFGAFLAGVPKRIYHVHTPFLSWKHDSPIKNIFAYFVNIPVNFIVSNIFSTDVLALTPSIKDIKTRKEKVFENKITIIPNGVDDTYFIFDQKERERIKKNYNIPQDSYVIGYNARFTEEKGHDILINAFKKVTGLNKDKNVYLILAGGGKLIEKYKELVNVLELRDRVIFTGKYNDEDKVALYSAMDLFVFPTLTEGFGLVMIEAMMMGLPVIASDIPVLRDVGENSVVFAKLNDENDFVEKINNLINDKKIYESYKEKGLKQSKKYTMQKFWDSYRKLYLGDK